MGKLGTDKDGETYSTNSTWKLSIISYNNVARNRTTNNDIHHLAFAIDPVSSDALSQLPATVDYKNQEAHYEVRQNSVS